MKSRVDGPIDGRAFSRKGRSSSKGDLLVEIDPRTFQAQLEQAEGQLARDQAQLNDAEANLARYQALWEAQA